MGQPPTHEPLGNPPDAGRPAYPGVRPEWPPPQWNPPGMPPGAVAPGWGPPAMPPPGMVAGPVGGSAPAPVGWLPASARSPYPQRPAPFHHFWRAPRWRWWKSLVLLGVGGVVFLLMQFAALFGAAAVDAATGRVPWHVFVDRLQHGDTTTTPAFFLANNICLDLLVPLSLLLSWALTRQRPGYLASVTGRLRWGWLARCMLAILPLWLVVTVAQYLLTRGQPDSTLHVTHDTWVLLVGIVVTTPLQCAGEEFAFRGVINRSIANWIPHEWLGFVLGGVVNSTLFMLAHGAGDPWLNVFYFTFGAVGTWLARRTGGLEASIAVHVVNNLTAEWTLPFTDISHMFDRSAGTAGPGILFQLALPLLAVAIIEWRARREHVVNRATAEATIPAPLPGAGVTGR